MSKGAKKDGRMTRADYERETSCRASIIEINPRNTRKILPFGTLLAPAPPWDAKTYRATLVKDEIVVGKVVKEGPRCVRAYVRVSIP